MCTFGVLGLSCEVSAAPKGLHTTARDPKRAHLRVLVFEMKNASEEGQRRAKFWAVPGGWGPVQGGPKFGPISMFGSVGIGQDSVGVMAQNIKTLVLVNLAQLDIGQT